MAERTWQVKGAVFGILNTYTGRYVSDSAGEILIFRVPRMASEYIAMYGLNSDVFKVKEL